jgi:hypothetical protein
MNKSSKEFFLALPDLQKIIFLAHLSNDLTIHGRGVGFYLTGEMQTAAFKGLNELQHQISQHIARLAEGSDRYPDEVLWEILQETSARYGMSVHLKQSLDGLVQRLGRNVLEAN